MKWRNFISHLNFEKARKNMRNAYYGKKWIERSENTFFPLDGIPKWALVGDISGHASRDQSTVDGLIHVENAYLRAILANFIGSNVLVLLRSYFDLIARVANYTTHSIFFFAHMVLTLSLDWCRGNCVFKAWKAKSRWLRPTLKIMRRIS